MIIKVNGRIWEPVPVLATAPMPVSAPVGLRRRMLTTMDQVEDVLKKLLPAGGMLAVAPPMNGPTAKLWPLIDQLQLFALWAGIAVSLWGGCRFILGDPGGKQVIGQALLGFIGLFVIPELFLAIYHAFN